MNALNRFAPHAHWFLRIALASVFLYHGGGKLMDLAGAAEMLQMPLFAAILIMIIEVGGVALILLGGLSKDWMTRVAGAGFAVIMVGAIATVHIQFGWNSVGAMGMEFQFTLLMISLFFLAVGNGDSGTAIAN